MSVTAQQEAFARYYVKYGKAATAYRKAYNVGTDTKPETVWVHASHLLADAKVATRVQYYQKLATERWSSSIEKIAEQLGMMAYLDKREIFDEHGAIKPHQDWPEHIARAVSGFEVFEQKDADGVVTGVTKKIRFESRAAAVALLAKWKGMLVDKIEVGAPGDFDQMSDEQIGKELAAEQAALRAIEGARAKSVKA